MPEESILGRYAEDVESGNAGMESHPACDNHPPEIDRATGNRAFSPLSPLLDTVNGAIRTVHLFGMNR